MSDGNTTWQKELTAALAENNETWADVESHTLEPDQLTRSFYAGYGGSEGDPFTLWTKAYVYFPIVYDGAEWVGCAPRNPNGVPTPHQGGQ